MMIRSLITACLALVLFITPVTLAARGKKSAGAARKQAVRARIAGSAARSKAAILNLTKQYKETLSGVLAFHEAEMRKAGAREEQQQLLYQRGAISRNELEASERALLDEKLKLAKLRTELADADEMIAEAEALDDFARFTRPGVFADSGALIRFSGLNGWSIMQIETIKKFFQDRFNRPLPISAYGQSAVHDRLGFDHRHAVDVAINPDSAEGQALMNYLRAAGIPFLAFRHALPGVATGAHIHIGRPSARL